jgi:ribosomal protein S18 acetylase RimI-like enzyme
MADIRLARPDDLDGILEVGRQTWPPTYVPLVGEEYVRTGLARWWTPEGTNPSLNDGRVWVAEVGGRIVGMAMYGIADRVAEVWKLYVLPDFQGQGIGRALLTSVIEAIRDTVDQIVLAHMDGNVSAREFFERMGFVETHRETDQLGGPDNVWMALRRW